MAKVTIETPYGFDQDDIDFSGLFYADSYNRGSKIFDAFYSDGAIDEFRGSGFKYDSEGVPTAGTIKSYAAFYQGDRMLIVDGVSIKVSALVDAAMTYSNDDDVQLLKKALGGADTFRGGAGDDVLKSYGGNDKLNGRLGADTLSGGSGKDTFVFDTKHGSGNVDKITDFSHKDDTIWLDDDIFKAIGKVPSNDKDGHVALKKSAFWASDSGKAHDASDRIIYDKTDGHLYYDADGNGAGKAVLFADLKAHLNVDASDFLLIA